MAHAIGASESFIPEPDSHINSESEPARSSGDLLRGPKIAASRIALALLLSVTGCAASNASSFRTSSNPNLPSQLQVSNSVDREPMPSTVESSQYYSILRVLQQSGFDVFEVSLGEVSFILPSLDENPSDPNNLGDLYRDQLWGEISKLITAEAKFRVAGRDGHSPIQEFRKAVRLGGMGSVTEVSHVDNFARLPWQYVEGKNNIYGIGPDGYGIYVVVDDFEGMSEYGKAVFGALVSNGELFQDLSYFTSSAIEDKEPGYFKLDKLCGLVRSASSGATIY